MNRLCQLYTFLSHCTFSYSFHFSPAEKRHRQSSFSFEEAAKKSDRLLDCMKIELNDMDIFTAFRTDEAEIKDLSFGHKRQVQISFFNGHRTGVDSNVGNGGGYEAEPWGCCLPSRYYTGCFNKMYLILMLNFEKPRALKENCNAKTSWFHMKERSKCLRTICISLESVKSFSNY